MDLGNLKEKDFNSGVLYDDLLYGLFSKGVKYLADISIDKGVATIVIMEENRPSSTFAEYNPGSLVGSIADIDKMKFLGINIDISNVSYNTLTVSELYTHLGRLIQQNRGDQRIFVYISELDKIEDDINPIKGVDDSISDRIDINI